MVFITTDPRNTFHLQATRTTLSLLRFALKISSSNPAWSVCKELIKVELFCKSEWSWKDHQLYTTDQLFIYYWLLPFPHKACNIFHSWIFSNTHLANNNDRVEFKQSSSSGVEFMQSSSSSGVEILEAEEEDRCGGKSDGHAQSLGKELVHRRRSSL